MTAEQDTIGEGDLGDDAASHDRSGSEAGGDPASVTRTPDGDVEPAMQSNAMLVLPWLLIIGAGALGMLAPHPGDGAGEAWLMLRDGGWLVGGVLLVVAGVRGVRTPGAPRASWALPVFGVALMAGTVLAAEVMTREALAFEAALADLFAEQEQDPRALMARFGDEAPTKTQSELSRTLAANRFADRGEQVEWMDADGTWLIFEPTAEDQRLRSRVLWMRGLPPKLERSQWLFGGALALALVLGFVLPARASMRLRVSPSRA